MENSKSPFKQTVANYPFWDFEKAPEFIGIYKETVVLGDETTFQANVFIDLSTGEYVYITDSYSIHKSVVRAGEQYPTELKAGMVVFSIKFLGKTEVKGKPFNQFNIGICTEEQWNAFNAAKGEQLAAEKGRSKKS